MAKIYLKGIKDPLYLDDVRAEEFKKLFEEGRLPPVVKIGDLATIRSADIKSVILSEDSKRKDTNSVPCGVEKCEGGCHWIIVRDDGRAIWKQPYQTKAMAQAEFSFENLSGYHLEHRFGR